MLDKDIELVIKIPNGAYDLLKTSGVDWLGAEHILDAVANGTVLPEHGRLIDADELKKNAYSASAFTQVVDVFDIDNAPTILGGVQNEC